MRGSVWQPRLRCRGVGEIVAAGRPEDIAEEPWSYTGQFLKELLERRPKGKREAAE